MQVARAFAVIIFIQPTGGSSMVPPKPIGITRRELHLDPDLDNTKYVLFPVFFLLPLLLLFITAVSTRWHQPTGTVLHTELGWGGENDLVRGNFP